MELENVQHDVVAKEFLAVVLAGFGDGYCRFMHNYLDMFITFQTTSTHK